MQEMLKLNTKKTGNVEKERKKTNHFLSPYNSMYGLKAKTPSKQFLKSD